MTEIADPRREEEAIAWATRQIGGRLVAREKQARWRPHWILNFAMPDGSTRQVLMRSYRNPGYTEMDHSGARSRQTGPCTLFGHRFTVAPACESRRSAVDQKRPF